MAYFSLATQSTSFKPYKAEQFEPMRMAFPSHQLLGTFANPFGAATAKEGSVVQKKLQETEVRHSQLATKEEIMAQSRVEVFVERAGTRNRFHRLDDGIDDTIEFVGELVIL